MLLKIPPDEGIIGLLKSIEKGGSLARFFSLTTTCPDGMADQAFQPRTNLRVATLFLFVNGMIWHNGFDFKQMSTLA